MISPLTPKNTKGWPATPTVSDMEYATNTLTMMQMVSEMHVKSVTIPAMEPECRRPEDTILITTPNGQEVEFDNSHQRRIEIPDEIIMNPNKVQAAQALHDVMQAQNFSKACADLFNPVRPSGPEETSWFCHTAAQLGDAPHTVGLVIQRESAKRSGKDDTAVTKLTRHYKWLGYDVNLQQLQGLTLHIFGALDIEEIPSYVIACPSYRVFEGIEELPVSTNDEPCTSMLHKIAKYHGADDCLWIPASNHRRLAGP